MPTSKAGRSFHVGFVLGLIAPTLVSLPAAALAQDALRVCADPNNLPFSNRRREGFENRIADLVARDLGERVAYVWWPQRRGFVRRTLYAGRCDVVIGVPADFDPVLTTRPYYTSTYVFVTRADHPPVGSFDDPRLRRLRIGVHFTGAGGNPPPAAALARRGLSGNIRSYSIYGDYRQPDPPARLIGAVSRGEVDVAVAWGPLAGYFARESRVPLRLVPVPPDEAPPGSPMTFAIAMGVRRGDIARRDRLQRVLDRRADGIRRILADFEVPLVGSGPSGTER
jgi:quinoprotein dehydrogenase-associated probable ABC transporter substrate-binding protein